MSNKYKPLTDPITRQEACLILDRRRFDGAVRAGAIIPLGKASGGGVVPSGDGAQTAPLLFNQQRVRDFARAVSLTLLAEAGEHRAAAKTIAKRQPPLTRRQIATHLGKRQTGILIRSGTIKPYGALTDTQTAAHTYDPNDVADAVNALADVRFAESKLLLSGSKTRVPA